MFLLEITAEVKFSLMSDQEIIHTQILMTIQFVITLNGCIEAVFNNLSGLIF
jgi:hypothetical protein